MIGIRTVVSKQWHNAIPTNPVCAAFVWGHVISSMLSIAWFTQNSVLHFWHDPFLPKKKCELEAHPHWVFHTVHQPVKRSVQICFGIFGGRFPYVSPTSGDIFQPAKELVAMISTVWSEPHFLTPGTQSHVGWKMMLLSNHGTTINYKHGQKQKHTHKKNVIRLELFKSFVVIAFCVLFHAFSCFCLWLVLSFFSSSPTPFNNKPPATPKKRTSFWRGMQQNPPNPPSSSKRPCKLGCFQYKGLAKPGKFFDDDYPPKHPTPRFVGGWTNPVEILIS